MPTATTEIYTLSLHDALPIFRVTSSQLPPFRHACSIPAETCSAKLCTVVLKGSSIRWPSIDGRSEEHTSELQSQSNLVCRLLLEKKNLTTNTHNSLYLYTLYA